MIKKMFPMVLLFVLMLNTSSIAEDLQIEYREIGVAKASSDSNQYERMMYEGKDYKIYDIYIIDQGKKILMGRHTLHMLFPTEYNRHPIVIKQKKDVNQDGIDDYILLISNGGRMFPGRIDVVDGETLKNIFSENKIKYPKNLYYHSREFIIANGKITEILAYTGEEVRKKTFFWNKQKKIFE